MFSEYPLDILRAKIICENCPLQKKCLDFALDHDISYGVWGGLDFEQRTKRCPVCHGTKHPERLGCNGAHSLERLARLLEMQPDDPTISVSGRGIATAPTSPGCIQPRGRSHSTAKAYREGCRCKPALRALTLERAGRPPASKKQPQTHLERFMSFVEVDGDHWWWKGGTNGSGYGNFWDGKRMVRAHIFAFDAIVGPIPSTHRLSISEECGNRLCVNPRHRVLSVRKSALLDA